MKKTIYLTLVIALLCSCASLEDRKKLDSYYQGANIASANPTVDGELQRFIGGIVAMGTTQENTIRGKRVRGIYTGNYGGCHHVAVLDLDVQKKEEIVSTDYRVCGSQITAIDELAPSYPDQTDALAALNSARRNAILYGAQTAYFQDYAINTRRLGVPSAQPCAPVETRITYHGQLVLQDVKQMCN